MRGRCPCGRGHGLSGGRAGPAPSDGAEGAEGASSGAHRKCHPHLATWTVTSDGPAGLHPVRLPCPVST
ncbi:hypothetical protein MICRO11B_210016 [Micrococcus luteus]|nr:hypothetical protein MICRO11B_210016 [Micrococcus luteus]